MVNKTQYCFAEQVLNWFDKHGRKDLPWQHDISGYRVWVSEIMLQQTQVQTVLPYYRTFMQQYPTVTDLAAAPLDEVLHLWTGLGYYARARNLHKTAQIITEQYQGEFPSSFADIVALPGIGRSTAGAICAIALQQRQPILDGNVRRVLTRFAAISGAIQNPTTLEKLWALADQFTPEKRIADYTQAIMDIGAIICTRSKPKCTECPLQTDCVAYQTHTQHLYPTKKITKKLPVKSTMMLIAKNEQGEILLEQRPPMGVWGGLWLFPQCTTAAEIPHWLRAQQLTLSEQTPLPNLRHTFSHYHLDIAPVLLTVRATAQNIRANDQFVWYNTSLKLGLAAPVKKLLTHVLAGN